MVRPEPLLGEGGWRMLCAGEIGADGRIRPMTKKRGYSREFTPPTDKHGRYLLDKIPAQFWREVRGKARREGISLRALILSLLKDWLQR
jgi:hypothetical protein